MAWMMAEILGMPRLMGTSEENDFSHNLQLSSRRVAIKPRNFNPNKQGYENVEKNELLVSTQASSNEIIEIGLESDWIYLGDVIVGELF